MSIQIATGAAAATRFHVIPGTAAGVRQVFEQRQRPLVLVSRHGLGDNIFCSPAFATLCEHFPKVYFCSSVNAYATIFHESPYLEVLYLGGVNGENLGLSDTEGFARHLERARLDLGAADASVYHFGLFEPSLPYEDERAFVKGRRNLVELFGTGPLADEVPRYHVAPDAASRDYVATVLNRWLPERELIAIARYGHTDGGKNFGDDSRDTVRTADLIDARFPERFKYLSLDYLPGDHAAEGRRPHIRSAYGFVPCDTASLYHVLCCAKLLITVPTGTMLVGAAIPQLKMLTLWKTMKPYHFLDPQFGSRNPVHALAARTDLLNQDFAAGWRPEARRALDERWRVRSDAVTPETVAELTIQMLENK